MDVLATLSSNENGNKGDFSIKSSSKIIVMQSGQMTPELSITLALSEKLTVLPFSGIPGKGNYSGISWREAAKAGSVSNFLIYWGDIETKYVNRKAISWVPIVGMAIPDETQSMRVTIKYIVTDVNTGQWEFGTVFSSESETSTSAFNRGSKDEEQISVLKAEVFSNFKEIIFSYIK
jgi:hypothetical protein